MLLIGSFRRSKTEPASCWIASSEKATVPADEGVEAVEAVEAVESVGAVWSMFLILVFHRGLQPLQFGRGRVAPPTDGGSTAGRKGRGLLAVVAVLFRDEMVMKIPSYIFFYFFSGSE